jgi:hypothetical protein
VADGSAFFCNQYLWDKSLPVLYYRALAVFSWAAQLLVEKKPFQQSSKDRVLLFTATAELQRFIVFYVNFQHILL